MLLPFFKKKEAYTWPRIRQMHEGYVYPQLLTRSANIHFQRQFASEHQLLLAKQTGKGWCVHDLPPRAASQKHLACHSWTQDAGSEKSLHWSKRAAFTFRFQSYENQFLLRQAFFLITHVHIKWYCLLKQSSCRMHGCGGRGRKVASSILMLSMDGLWAEY